MIDEDPTDPLEAFEARAREVLCAGEHDVSPEVAERLESMRRAAVRQLEERAGRRRPTRWVWAPLGAAATVALALGIFLFSGGTQIPVIDELDEAQLAAAEDMELLEELEFLAWMEEQERNAG